MAFALRAAFAVVIGFPADRSLGPSMALALRAASAVVIGFPADR